MHDLDFSPRDLVALRALMAMEPVPGQPLPDPAPVEVPDPANAGDGCLVYVKGGKYGLTAAPTNVARSLPDRGRDRRVDPDAPRDRRGRPSGAFVFR